jgi:hypothetical protein
MQIIRGSSSKICALVFETTSSCICTYLGRALHFVGYNSRILFLPCELKLVLSSITKKGEIESASRPLIDFGDS